MPWRRMLKGLTFTPDEWQRNPVGTLVRTIRTAGDIVKAGTE